MVGAGTVIGPHAVVGAPPQIRGVQEGGTLRIGRNNRLRELVTVHVGSPGQTTILGNGNLLMAYAHVAHDCHLGDEIELANAVQLGGHVEIGDRAVVGGLAAVHQFCRVGCYAMVAAGAMVAQDVLPFSLVAGDRARTLGINAVGLRRWGFDSTARRRLAHALRLLQRAPTLKEGIHALEALSCGDEAVAHLWRFAQSTKRGLCR